MSSYKNQFLFSTGPHSFHVQGLSLRLQKVETPSLDGAMILSLGRTERRIDQAGTLGANSVGELQEQVDAIETVMDGDSGELVDEYGRRFARMVLVQLVLGPIRRTGVRVHLDYEAVYLQTQEIVEGLP